MINLMQDANKGRMLRADEIARIRALEGEALTFLNKASIDSQTFEFVAQHTMQLAEFFANSYTRPYGPRRAPLTAEQLSTGAEESKEDIGKTLRFEFRRPNGKDAVFDTLETLYCQFADSITQPIAAVAPAVGKAL